MVEKLTKQFGAEKYLNLGGRWTKETFDELMDILANKEENPIPVRKMFLDHAEGIKKYSGVEITPEEIYLYGVLRERPVENLSDINLMAEVILLGGDTAKRKLFESKYPNVDFRNVIQGLGLELRGVRKIPYSID